MKKWTIGELQAMRAASRFMLGLATGFFRHALRGVRDHSQRLFLNPFTQFDARTEEQRCSQARSERRDHHFGCRFSLRSSWMETALVCEKMCRANGPVIKTIRMDAIKAV